MLTKRDVNKIQKLYYEKGYSQNRIAKETGFNRATIKKYLSEEIEGGESGKVKLHHKKDLFQNSNERRNEEEDIKREIEDFAEAERRGETICLDVKREPFLFALCEVLNTFLSEDLNKNVSFFMQKLAQYKEKLAPEDFYAQLLLNNVDEEKAEKAAYLYAKYLKRVEKEGACFIIEKADQEGRFKCLNKYCY